MLAQTADNIEKLVEEPLASKVARYGKVPANTRVNAHHLGDLHNEARRQVVDAEVAHVFKHMHGLRASRAGHTGDDYHVGNAVGKLGGGDF